ncbi:MAG: hypothetical protein HKO57_05495, partial [Akkermansiaceae bacterium]|nr:hypothetical protein [Akkermansiaceae bacterium]
MKSTTVKILIVPLVTLFALTACEPPENAAEKAALEKRVAELEREKAEMAQAAAEAALAEEREALAAERAAMEVERAALQAALEASAPKAIVVEEDPEAAKLAVEVTDVPAGELSHQSHEGLARIAAQVLGEVVEKVAEKKARKNAPARPAVAEVLRAEPVGDDDFGIFYANLQNYGSWFQTTDYGYAWQPAVVRTDPQWRPYTRGHWLHSDQGWTWASDEPFGWAAYHYGRWALLEGVGWVWIPGEQWAPAWVTWRRNDDYIGWAPLPPETLHNRDCAYDTRVDQIYSVAPSWYTFVPVRSFGQPVRPVCVPAEQGIRIAITTRNVTRIYKKSERVYVAGPDYKWVSSRRGSAAPTCKLAAVDHRTFGPRPMRNRVAGNRYEVCAPKVNAAWNAAVRPAAVTRNLGRVTVVRTGGAVDRRALEHYYHETLERRELARRVAATEQGRRELMRRQIAIKRAEELTRAEAQRYHEQCAREAQERARQEALAKAREVEEARRRAEDERRAAERKLREERERQARMTKMEAERQAELQRLADEKQRAEMMAREALAAKAAEKAARQRQEEALKAQMEFRRQAEAERVKAEELERRKAEEMKLQAEAERRKQE